MERSDESVDPVELLDQHRRLTSRLARRYGRFEAEDLASEALARSLRRPARAGAHQPWLERILRNLVVDRARRSGRAAAHAAALSCGGDVVTAPTPEEDLLLAERRRAVQAALPAIPSGLREALVGRFYEGRDYQSEAATRGISPATARTRVHRALASLRLSLGRLRLAVPWPQLLGGHSFSATTALLPAALSAALVVPSLAAAPLSLTGTDVGVVLMAQAAPRGRARPPAVEPFTTTRVEAAPAAVAGSGSGSSPEKPGRNMPARRPLGPQQQQEHADPPAPAEGKAAAVMRYDFENDKVEGILARPDGDGVRGDPVVKHASLIEIRREFVSEIAKMLEDL